MSDIDRDPIRAELARIAAALELIGGILDYFRRHWRFK